METILSLAINKGLLFDTLFSLPTGEGYNVANETVFGFTSSSTVLINSTFTYYWTYSLLICADYNWSIESSIDFHHGPFRSPVIHFDPFNNNTGSSGTSVDKATGSCS